MFFPSGCFFRLMMVRCRTILPGMKRNLGHLLSLLHERSAKWLSGEMAGAGLGGLAPSHGDVLACLFQRGGATMHELAAFARRTKPTTTILVDKLEALGYVSRGPSPADARSTIVSLTPAGEALRPAFDDISRRYCDFLYSGLSPREAATLERLLEKSLAAPTGTPPRRPTVKPSNHQTPKPPEQRRIP